MSGNQRQHVVAQLEVAVIRQHNYKKNKPQISAARQSNQGLTFSFPREMYGYPGFTRRAVN